MSILHIENDIGISDDGKCRCGKAEIKVFLSAKAEIQINSLIYKYPKTEWIAYLRGEKIQNKDIYRVAELVLAEQENGMATTEFTAKGDEAIAKEKGIIGWIHSHNSMDVFQSSTDEESAKQHEVSITTNNKKEFFCRVRHTFLCGDVSLVKADVLRETDMTIDTAFISEAEKLIKEKTYETAYTNGYYNGGYADDWRGYTNPDRDSYEAEKGECVVCWQKLSKNLAKRVECKECFQPCHINCVNEDGICRFCAEEERISIN